MLSTSEFAYRSARRASGALLLAVALTFALSPCAGGSYHSLRARASERVRREGPILEAIHFAGNDTFDRATLLRYMRVSESGFFRTVRYKRRALEQDLANIERFYMTRGFMEAQATVEDERLSADSLRVEVLIGLYEGPRWVIADVSFEGNVVMDDDRLRRNVTLAPGSPFLSNELEADRRSLLDVYARNSYLDARVFQTVEVDDDRQTVDVRYRVVEREQASIASIDVTGDDKTRQYIVEREFTLTPGDLFDPDEIGETQARVYRTGLFHSVWMEPAEEDTGKVSKRLLVRVRERPSGHVDLKVGYAALTGPEVAAGITNRNVQGQAIEMSLKGAWSGFQRGGEASVGDPWFTGRRVAAEATGSYYWNDEESYVAETAGGSFVLTKRLGNAFTLEGGYEFARTSILDSGDETRDTGVNYTSNILSAVTYDTRNDILDAKRGMMARARIDLASSRLGGTNDFVRYELAFRSFIGLRHGRVAALSLRTGWVKPQGDGGDVPVNERYFAGGDGSVRGFERNSLSPLDAGGSPKGGRALAEARLEVRFHVWRKLRAVVFADAGQTFDDLGALRASLLEVGVGGGLRVETPVGVLRLDLAVPVTEDGPVKYYFGIGQAF
ncbi:MAG: outer membrane protein assembly factor BamA [Candidatus Eisenbacteria bacterium]